MNLMRKRAKEMEEARAVRRIHHEAKTKETIMDVTLADWQLYQALEKAIRVIIDNLADYPEIDWGLVEHILAKIEQEGL